MSEFQRSATNMTHEQINEFLKRFLELGKKEPMQQYIETVLFSMVNLAMNNVDRYVNNNKDNVDENVIASIIISSFQHVVTKMKSGLDIVNSES